MFGVLINLGEFRVKRFGDSGTLKGMFSASLDFRGDGDHVTLFFGVLKPEFWGKRAPEGEIHSNEVLTGVLRMPLRGLPF